MNKHRIVWLMALLLMVLTGTAATARLSIDSFSISAGEEKVIEISLANPDDEVTLVQFDMILPTGLSIKTEGGEYVTEVARTTWRKHSLDANVQSDGSIRFLLASSSNSTLSGSEGAIIKLTLVANSNFAGGDIKLSNILMVTPNEKEMSQADLSLSIGNNIPPTPTPTPGTAKLSVSDFAITKGEEAVMEIALSNPDDEITLVQFDLKLPVGLAIKTDGGEYVTEVARTTWRKHSLDANVQADGSIRFLLASSSNSTLSGSEGTIIKLTLVANSNFAGGDIKLSNILMVTPGEKEMSQADLSLSISNNPTPTPTPGTAKLSVSDFTIAKGKEAVMEIALSNPDDEITLVQFDLKLPIGLAIKTDGGEYVTEVARTTWRKHSLDANVQADGSIRFLLASSSNSTLSGSEGTIIKLTLVANSDFAGGDIKLNNILMVTPDEKEISQADLSLSIGNNIPPTPTPTSGTAKLSVSDFTIAKGEEAVMEIALSNPDDEITLVQFDLKLPIGLAIKTEGSAPAASEGRFETVKTAIWENDGSLGPISWGGDYCFAPESNSTGEECYTVPQNVWKKMKSQPFYATVKGEKPQLRITTSWWSTALTADDIMPGNELLTDNGDGTWTVLVDPSSAPDFLEVLDVQHLLFTGSGYTVQELYFKEEVWVGSPKDGEYVTDIARTTWKKHSLDANVQADGSIRFLLASSSNSTLSGSEGAIIKVTLVAGEGFEGGDVQLSNILLVTPDEKEMTQEAFTCHADVLATIKPESILLPTNKNVAVGEVIAIVPEINPSNAVTTLTWTSDDETIARVNEKGEVTGVKAGQTFINVQTDNGLSGWCKLTVTAPAVTRIVIPEKETVCRDEMITLTATLLPEGATGAITWTSDDETIARVNAKGEVIGIKEGLAIIYATAENGVRSNPCKLKVDVPAGIQDVKSADNTFDVWTTAGMKVRSQVTTQKGLPAGIYIVNGRKVVVKGMR